MRQFNQHLDMYPACSSTGFIFRIHLDSSAASSSYSSPFGFAEDRILFWVLGRGSNFKSADHLLGRPANRSHRPLHRTVGLSLIIGSVVLLRPCVPEAFPYPRNRIQGSPCLLAAITILATAIEFHCFFPDDSRNTADALYTPPFPANGSSRPGPWPGRLPGSRTLRLLPAPLYLEARTRLRPRNRSIHGVWDWPTWLRSSRPTHQASLWNSRLHHRVTSVTVGRSAWLASLHTQSAQKAWGIRLGNPAYHRMGRYHLLYAALLAYWLAILFAAALPRSPPSQPRPPSSPKFDARPPYQLAPDPPFRTLRLHKKYTGHENNLPRASASHSATRPAGPRAHRRPSPAKNADTSAPPAIPPGTKGLQATAEDCVTLSFCLLPLRLSSFPQHVSCFPPPTPPPAAPPPPPSAFHISRHLPARSKT